MPNAPYGSVMLAGLFLWAVYRRLRRNIGRQKLKPRRIMVSMVILSLVTLFLLTTTFTLPLLALAFAGGALLGVAGSLLGLRHTKFETTADGHFYTPNTYIGLALSLLLLGRMVYRLILLQNHDYTTGHPAVFQSPLTFFIMGLTIGYYLSYYTGLFIHTHDRR